jgi:hypothetical protein
LSNSNELDQKGLIITDDISLDPILDFNLYRNAIVNIIRNSYPKFTIGIFGDWGTGKSTLMDSIDKKLRNEDHDLVIVRFDTWRYERENQFALIPLLKTIQFSIPEEKYKNLKEAFKEAGIFGLRISTDFLSGFVTTQLGKIAGDSFKKGLDNFSEKVIPELKKINEIEKNTIYFEGQKKIENLIKKIRESNPSFRIVVFVDDLDRCSPKKTLEVLESIKIFLGMEGFIYVIGMSHDVVTKLIDLEYKESDVKGEQYIKKIIQIPITLPKWDNQDIINLVKDFVKKEIIDIKYKQTIDENIELISTAIENNPREIKRFLNNFIVTSEIFSSSQGVVAKELLVIQAIQLRWNKFYDLLIKSDETFLEDLNRYLQMDEETFLKNLDSEKQQVNENSFNSKVKKLLRDFKTDTDLWSFLKKNSATLNNIKSWSTYRRATEVSKEPILQEVSKEPILQEVSKEPILKLKQYHISSNGKIFVAYSRQDADFASHVHRYLRDKGYNVFIDVNSIRTGEPWTNSIEKNISECDIFVVILTHDSLTSPYIEKEILFAQKENKTIIPCLYEDIEYNDIKWGLEKIQGIKFSDEYKLTRRLSYILK